MSYREFLQRKTRSVALAGFTPDEFPAFMRKDQMLVTERAIRSGRYCIFADCGLGKTIDELEFARQVSRHHGPVMILAPLCVSMQTKHIGAQFGYEVNVCRRQADVKSGINISNYELLDHFEPSAFAGVVLDESSILKNFSGKIRTAIIDAFARTRFKLACSATPARTAYQAGNHCEFMGNMSRSEMLAMYFVHDGGETQKWRLKGHAESAFWKWVSTWSTTYGRPSECDASFSDEGFALPALHLHEWVIGATRPAPGHLFHMPAEDFSSARAVKRDSISERVERACQLALAHNGPCVLWCDLNDEGDALERQLSSHGGVQLSGSDTLESKEDVLWAFSRGDIKRLITKQKIASFGLNWQHCNQTIFVGPNYSYEAAYQAIKRFHRFGQKRDVHAHWVMMDLEYNVFRSLKQKMADHGRMKEALQCVS